MDSFINIIKNSGKNGDQSTKQNLMLNPKNQRSS